MKRILAVLLVPLVCGAGSAWAAQADNTRFLVAGRLEDPSLTMVGSGAITGIGTLTAESADYRQADNTYRETDLAAIGGGTLTIVVDGRFSVWPFTVDPRTCTRQGTLTGTWTVTGGGGDFTGASGGGTFAGRFFVYAGRGAGGCDETALKGLLVGPMAGDVTVRQECACGAPVRLTGAPRRGP